MDLPADRSHDGEAGDVRGLALVGRHAERRVALQMLDRFKAFALRQFDVGGGDVVLVVDKGLALAGDMPERRQRKRLVVGDRRGAGIAAAPGITRRRSTGGKALAQAGAKSEVAVGGTGGDHARRRAVRHEGGDVVAPFRPAAMVGGQPDRRVPAAGNGKPVGLDFGARAAGQRHRDLAHAVLAAVDAADRAMQHGEAVLGGQRAMRRRYVRPCVDHRRDLQSGAERGLDRAPAILIVGEQRDALCRRGRIARDIGAHRRRHHHAGRVVAGKDDRPLDGAGRDDAALGHDPPQPLAHLMFGRRAAGGR